MPTKLSALEALERLREGNLRFANNLSNPDKPLSHQRREELMSGQEPFAIILGCSDSRVPAEIIFDQGLGDLFVIRVAGNIVAPSQVGSVEFAVSRYHTRLVIVLGHSRCGAVTATLETLLDGEGTESRNVAAIVNRVMPAVRGLLDTELRHDRPALLRASVRANVRASVDHLRHGSAIIESLIQDDGLVVIGAEYSLESGMVDFFDGAPGGS
ncbi:carbonic anhydrase [Thiocystis violacea]|uniref:carbonic anhydrase n=1 Tax=Thiocystis violacea TaxID=13725 RepID=UPI0019085871|nr:carbonic anhydrase [Thiocystis violacea]MBK1721762.1 carbonic anhydrase [Thiocystis violacea]